MFIGISLTLYSCALSKAIYLGSNDYSHKTGSFFTDEEYSAENINSKDESVFPEAVYIKTRTQTFNLYHYYILHEGKVFIKNIDNEKEPKEWTPLAGTGIPRGTTAIIEISADADELAALSAEGNFYRYFFDRTILYSKNKWLDKQGWPASEQIYFDQRTSKNRSWALGKRNHHVLYYEDIFGNQHHNGTMEIATTYVLLEDGQEICYGDTGLPSDFSRNFIGPERGAFISVSLSASASTMFVINEAGEMYTRLVDFDTVGNDPMFFKYTYSPYTSHLAGTEYFSNLNEWGLPSEDWRAQPRIPLSGNAAITRHITILQNGHGNSARELRVAGLNEQGETGYWSKQIFDKVWNFVIVPLNFKKESILQTSQTFDINRQGERGLSPDKSYSGYNWNNNEIESAWEYQIPNFNILEGDCDLQITFNGETCVFKLHPIEMWTYIKRDYLPGRTGHPKLFLVTLEIPDKMFESLSESFVKHLTEKFAKYNRKLFHYILTAANNYIIIREFNNNNSLIFLTDGTIPADYSEIHFGHYIENFNDVYRRNSPELIVNDNDNLTIKELKDKISLNKEFADELKHRIRVIKWSQLTSFKINTSYLTAHYIAKLTPLRFVDVPKIKTVTSYGNRLVLANNSFINTTSNARIWLYENIIEMLETRIICYNDILKNTTGSSSANSGTININMPSYYSENICEYWDIAGLPRTISGVFYSSGARNQLVQIPAQLSFLPSQNENNISGWHFFIGESSDINSGDFSIFIEADNSAKVIYSRRGKTPLEKTLKLDCTLFINNNAADSTEREVIDRCLKPFISEMTKKIKIRITFNGKTFEIREYPARRGNSLIFKGSLESAH
ncbi:MAG: hypothetical protein FWC22_00735 [Treponema sp.]|nr:hypothetical protein [Treponema sp.]